MRRMHRDDVSAKERQSSQELELVTKEAGEIKECCLLERMQGLAWIWHPFIFVFTHLVAHLCHYSQNCKSKSPVFTLWYTHGSKGKTGEVSFAQITLYLGDITEFSSTDTLWSRFCVWGNNRASKVHKQAKTLGTHGEWFERHNPPKLREWKYMWRYLCSLIFRFLSQIKS